MKKFELGASNIYFIGIGGVSMSGLAHILQSMDYNISGSDKQKSVHTQNLESIGIQINYAQIRENINNNIDLIIYTAAIKDDNPEYMAAVSKNIPIMSRAQLLGKLISYYKYSICIAGTHGKTTTTSMVAHLLIQNGLNPTISVGATFPLIGGNFKLGNSEYFVVESCEYNDSFLEFKPYIGVILNIEYDHPDHFKDITQLEQSFSIFANNVLGYLIVNKGIKNYKNIIKNTKATVITFGENEGDFTFKPISNNSFNLNGSLDISLPIFGKHNMENASAALCIANTLSLKFNKNSFELYENPKRRLEFKGTTPNGAIVMDDYAHHPTEIKSTLLSIKKQYPNREIICVFQPHTYSRTIGLLQEFAVSFTDADTLILLDIYGARETSGKIHTKDLMSLITSTLCLYFDSFEKVENYLIENLKINSLLITMGATNVNLIGEKVLSN